MASHHDDYYVQQPHGHLTEDHQLQAQHPPHGQQYDAAFAERYPDPEEYDTSRTTEATGHPQSPFDMGPFLGDDFFALPTSPSAGPIIGSSASSTAAVSALGASGIIGEDLLSAAIEEDKRRRNTAASARFRMKKKEREAELERRSKEMNDRCSELQKRIGVLETENRWLRELITERSKNRVFPSAKGKPQKEEARGEEEKETIVGRRRRSGS
jgi:Skp family chaperone for outer membrane proteins